MNLALPVLALTIAAPQPPPVKDPAMKERMKSALTATELNFSEMPSGATFYLVFDNADNRKRNVYVAAEGSKLLSLVCHTIYTPVWQSDKEPSPELIKKAFGSHKKLGAFYSYKELNGKWTIRFGAQYDISDLSATPSKDQNSVARLKDTIYFVNQVGDEAEKAFAGQS